MFKKINSKGTFSPDGALLDAGGRVIVAPAGSGGSTALGVTATTQIKVGAGTIATVNVIVAGTTPGTVNDAATTGAAAPANQIASIPNVVGIYVIGFPFTNGLVVVPGAGQTLSVSYS
jgi:hypothetical protein